VPVNPALAGETLNMNTRHTKIVKSKRNEVGLLDTHLHALGALVQTSSSAGAMLPEWCLRLPAVKARSLLFGSVVLSVRVAVVRF